MKNVRCPCCGITILNNKEIKTVKRSEISSQTELISCPEGWNDAVWERFVRAYNLSKVVEG